MLFPPQPQSKLVDFYPAADVAHPRPRGRSRSAWSPSRGKPVGTPWSPPTSADCPTSSRTAGAASSSRVTIRATMPMHTSDPAGPSAPVDARRRGGPAGAPVHGCDDRSDGVGVRRGARTPFCRLTCSVHGPLRRWVTVRSDLSLFPCCARYQRVHALTCGNAGVEPCQVPFPVQFAFAPPGRSIDARRPDEGSGAARKAETEPGEPTKAARPDAGRVEPTKAARPEAEPPGPGRRRKDEAGPAPGGTPSGGPQGSPAAAGCRKASRRAAGDRGVFGRAEPAGPTGHRRDEAEVAWST